MDACAIPAAISRTLIWRMRSRCDPGISSSGKVCSTRHNGLRARKEVRRFLKRLCERLATAVIVIHRIEAQIGPWSAKPLDIGAAAISQMPNEGATLIAGGKRTTASGFYWTHRFADVTTTMTIAKDEISGLVMSVADPSR